MAQAVSPFTLDSFDQEPAYCDDGPAAYARARIAKTFTGDIEATSGVEMLSVRVDGAPAGYVALERVVGTVAGRRGSFALLHAGTMHGDEYWARWPVVPGSGTGELEGISGEGRIEIAPDGAHTFFLDYELP
jgi:hypothetical protein